MTPRSSTHRYSCADAGAVQLSTARHTATATGRLRIGFSAAMDGRFDNALLVGVRLPKTSSRARIAPESEAHGGRMRFQEASKLLGRRLHRCFTRFGCPFQPQMHDDRCEFAFKLLLCELQCSINCVHVCSCYPTFCLALTVASPARRATLVLDTDFRLVKSAVRTFLQEKKSPHRSLLATRRANEGFTRTGIVPRG
jgi:hypothetical protein